MKKIMMGVTILLLFIGGSCMKKVEPVNKEEQERVITYFLSYYKLKTDADVKKIEVVAFQKNNMTQTWRITLKINDAPMISFKEDYLGGTIHTSNYSPDEFYRVDDAAQRTIKMEYIEIIYLKDGNRHESNY